MKCECGAEVDPMAYANAISAEIAEGNVVTEASVSACPACAPYLDGDGHIFMLVIE